MPDFGKEDKKILDDTETIKNKIDRSDKLAKIAIVLGILGIILGVLGFFIR